MEEQQLAIQVNLFNCSGTVISLCISHKIVDGCSLSSFIKAWVATARSEASLVCPSFISASLFPPREPLSFKLVAHVPEAGLVSGRLVFSTPTVASLKAEAAGHGDLTRVEPTRVEVVTTLIWNQYCSIARTSMALHSVNIRRMMVPALGEHCFGNLFLMANAVSDGESYLGMLMGKLRGTIEKIDNGYIRERQGEGGFEVFSKNLRRIGEVVSRGEEVQLLRFSSWCGFPIYEADFGWGKPSWVGSASTGTRNSIFLLDSRSPGGVGAWVTLHQQDVVILDQLHAFISSFSKLLNLGKIYY